MYMLCPGLNKVTSGLLPLITLLFPSLASPCVDRSHLEHCHATGCLAGAAVAGSVLPPKLNSIVQPLMECLRIEAETVLRVCDLFLKILLLWVKCYRYQTSLHVQLYLIFNHLVVSLIPHDAERLSSGAGAPAAAGCQPHAFPQHQVSSCSANGVFAQAVRTDCAMAEGSSSVE